MREAPTPAALVELIDPVENPQRARRLLKELETSRGRAVGDAFLKEVPLWEAARGRKTRGY
jgi:hypothetical protein